MCITPEYYIQACVSLHRTINKAKFDGASSPAGGKQQRQGQQQQQQQAVAAAAV